ncbi:MAG: endonuclease domain-containing protein [Actinobacteria bacterium]|nr:endonuclease domain-containing protein [Actinomycetota bacterium]
MPRRDRRLLRFAREMRRDPTPSEERIWRELRAGRFGVKFRRQEEIGPFIADFACRSLRLIVEFDGESHDDERKDQRRDDALAALGWKVIRYDDSEVYEDVEAVLEDLWRHIHGDE